MGEVSGEVEGQRRKGLKGIVIVDKGVFVWKWDDCHCLSELLNVRLAKTPWESAMKD